MEQEEQACVERRPVVVLGVDDSKHSDYAFQYYVNQVHRPDFMMHVIHCSEAWATAHPMDGGPSPAHVKELKEKDQKALTDLENKYKKLMADNRIDGKFQVIPGGKHSWNEIINYQEKVHGIMIVLGTRGNGAVRRTVLGSVSDSVVHHALCPVLVCRQ